MVSTFKLGICSTFFLLINYAESNFSNLEAFDLGYVSGYLAAQFQKGVSTDPKIYKLTITRINVSEQSKMERPLIILHQT